MSALLSSSAFLSARPGFASADGSGSVRALRLSCDPQLLLVRERDAHLLERRRVERAGHLEPFGLLVLPEPVARGRVQLARKLARVEAPLLQNLLRLFDLLLRGAEDGAALLSRVRVVFGRGGDVGLC